MRAAILLVLLAGCELVFEVDPQTMPFLDGYDRRRAIDIVVDLEGEPLVNFPLAVRVPGIGNETADTISFTAADGTSELLFEVEGIENDELLAWVQIPSFDGQRIYLYLGGPTAIGRDSSDAWSSAFAGVWHLAAEGSDLADGTGDSTARRNDLVPLVRPIDVEGVFGHGRNFDSTMQLRCGPLGPTRGLDFGTASFSFSVWINTGDDSNGNSTPLAFGGGATGGYGLFLGGGAWEVSVSDGTEIRTNVSAAPVLDTWVHLVGVVDRENAQLRTFINGTPGNARALPPDFGSTSSVSPTLLVVSRPDGEMESQEAFVGVVDELRIYAGVVSPTQASVEYLNLTKPDLLAIGPEELR
jgi:hypothetical protein